MTTKKSDTELKPELPFTSHIKEELPFPVILNAGEPALTYDEIRANLAKPIPKELISGKKQYDKKNSRSITIDYVNVTDLKDILDSRAGLWSASIKEFKSIGNELGVVISLTVYTSTGNFIQDGNGSEKLDHSGFGDSFSNAYAQAFRRACEGHGLGRHLWRKHEIRVAEYSEQGQQAQQNQVPESTKQAANAQPSINSQPNGGTNGNSGELITPKQRLYLENVCKEKGIEPNSVISETFPDFTIDTISKKNASIIINKVA